jgi:flagellar biosynthesis protein FlhG
MSKTPDRLIAILGSGPLAGASSVTRNLAAALSKSGEAVLLLDPSSYHLKASGEGRITLLDVDRNSDDAQADLIARADCVLVVLEPNPASITSAYASIKKLRQAGSPQKLLVMVNQAGERGAATRILLNLAYTCEHYLKLDLGLVGVVCHDSRVSQAERLNMTAVETYPGTTVAQEFFAVAALLVKSLQPAVMASSASSVSQAVPFVPTSQRQPLAAVAALAH